MSVICCNHNNSCFKNIFLQNKKFFGLKRYFIFLFLIIFIFNIGVVYSNTTDENSDYVEDLYANTYDTIDNLDLSKLDELLDGLEDNNIFVHNISDTIKDIINGNFDIDADNLFSYVLSVVFGNLKSIFPICILILIVTIIVRILMSFSPEIFKDGIADIINFVAIGVIVVVLGRYVISVNGIINSTINTMQSIQNIIFPILLTMMGAIGATSSVAIYTPITTILNTTVSMIMTKFLYPLYLLSFALIVVSVITKRIKLDKFITFISTLFKTSLGFVFTLFSGIFVIKGISAGKYDSVSIYTTKFAVKNYIPLIGSYLSEGFNYIMLSSVLVKNAIGLAGVILILVVVLSPVVYLLVLKLLLGLTASFVDVLGCNTISSIVDKVAKIMVFPIAIILGVAFMFIMSLSLVMCTANLI